MNFKTWLEDCGELKGGASDYSNAESAFANKIRSKYTARGDTNEMEKSKAQKTGKNDPRMGFMKKH